MTLHWKQSSSTRHYALAEGVLLSRDNGPANDLGLGHVEAA